MITRILVALLILVGLPCCQKQEPYPSPKQQQASPAASPTASVVNTNPSSPEQKERSR